MISYDLVNDATKQELPHP